MDVGTHDLLNSAIRARAAISFLYENLLRIVEPHLYGRDRRQKAFLRGFQTSGQSLSGGLPEWRLFDVDKISQLKIVDAFFTPRNDFNPTDPIIDSVYAKV